MGWADNYIKKLQAGEVVRFRPRGNSMSPRIKDRQLVTVIPLTKDVPLCEDAIVLCLVRGRQYLHLVKGWDGLEHRVLIGNNKGNLNGWTPLDIGGEFRHWELPEHKPRTHRKPGPRRKSRTHGRGK